LTGDAQPPIARLPGGQQDDVVGGAQLRDGEVAADGDVAQEADGGRLESAREQASDVAGLRMIRCDAVADETERRGGRLEDIDTVERVEGVEGGQGVRAGRPGPDDGGGPAWLGWCGRRDVGVAHPSR